MGSSPTATIFFGFIVEEEKLHHLNANFFPGEEDLDIYNICKELNSANLAASPKSGYSEEILLSIPGTEIWGDWNGSTELSLKEPDEENIKEFKKQLITRGLCKEEDVPKWLMVVEYS